MWGSSSNSIALRAATAIAGAVFLPIGSRIIASGLISISRALARSYSLILLSYLKVIFKAAPAKRSLLHNAFCGLFVVPLFKKVKKYHLLP